MYRNDMPRPTRGLSTLEVMISIGVAIIGLLGALALLLEQMPQLVLQAVFIFQICLELQKHFQ